MKRDGVDHAKRLFEAAGSGVCDRASALIFLIFRVGDRHNSHGYIFTLEKERRIFAVAVGKGKERRR